uniref:Uncharacterized protein n=1 Tax=Chromera velia CCMP2878 TaxID=1169474 RepID=A0A0G4HGY7_9ALVE|eukprot:Cvel_27487.t1-p1 / transcript=Cvel_27487.t1 / gene=Cvel_27487 / organism=Chromera_velia_CCMP2878 / gene_product=hypothetical protein / transcript_product=hypothetical protein / location=Cvel_scaffold3437:5377-7200(+) / protein_length=608 / sequence_SO=supercontig / SO=protein_coding / is_pseudo=false
MVPENPWEPRDGVFAKGDFILLLCEMMISQATNLKVEIPVSHGSQNERGSVTRNVFTRKHQSHGGKKEKLVTFPPPPEEEEGRGEEETGGSDRFQMRLSTRQALLQKQPESGETPSAPERAQEAEARIDSLMKTDWPRFLRFIKGLREEAVTAQRHLKERAGAEGSCATVSETKGLEDIWAELYPGGNNGPTILPLTGVSVDWPHVEYEFGHKKQNRGSPTPRRGEGKVDEGGGDGVGARDFSGEASQQPETAGDAVFVDGGVGGSSGEDSSSGVVLRLLEDLEGQFLAPVPEAEHETLVPLSDLVKPWEWRKFLEEKPASESAPGSPQTWKELADQIEAEDARELQKWFESKGREWRKMEEAMKLQTMRRLLDQMERLQPSYPMSLLDMLMQDTTLSLALENYEVKKELHGLLPAEHRELQTRLSRLKNSSPLPLPKWLSQSVSSAFQRTIPLLGADGEVVAEATFRVAQGASAGLSVRTTTHPSSNSQLFHGSDRVGPTLLVGHAVAGGGGGQGADMCVSAAGVGGGGGGGQGANGDGAGNGGSRQKKGRDEVDGGDGSKAGASGSAAGGGEEEDKGYEDAKDEEMGEGAEKDETAENNEDIVWAV